MAKLTHLGSAGSKTPRSQKFMIRYNHLLELEFYIVYQCSLIYFLLTVIPFKATRDRDQNCSVIYIIHLHSFNDTMELDSAVSLKPQSLIQRYHWHRRVWFSGITDTMELDSAVSLTPQSLTQWWQWNCGLFCTGQYSTQSRNYMCKTQLGYIESWILKMRLKILWHCLADCNLFYIFSFAWPSHATSPHFIICLACYTLQYTYTSIVL